MCLHKVSNNNKVYNFYSLRNHSEPLCKISVAYKDHALLKTKIVTQPTSQ